MGEFNHDEQAEYIVNRLEIIEWDKPAGDGGRNYVKWEDYDFNVVFDQQDDGRTLKIFLTKPTQTKTTKEEG